MGRMKDEEIQDRDSGGCRGCGGLVALGSWGRLCPGCYAEYEGDMASAQVEPHEEPDPLDALPGLLQDILVAGLEPYRRKP